MFGTPCRPASASPGRASCSSRSTSEALRAPPPDGALGWRAPKSGHRTGAGQPTRILLADEPTGSLDSASTVRFLDLLERLSGHGMTIVMVTHDADVAAQAHRTVEMRDGVVVSEDAAEMTS